ncbi:MAG: antitoxin Xre/MbcA/ParS toxin-binding domain-containing protein [Thiofilum sp.]|uniref:antitoxin Xre/MbcA/ParS toxin-binding domain-containing protein n=1 Tax=Thiofilum sp. TaxID=2212733 RepID=UPI0025E1130E|nr:antitoxin Xre/MbcA/ParS toxin-binding domain-containing protein [Thiofilum sp.]MBK8454210.1 DUF2384 domain-containing protein [Thiofilum sp.]
MSDFNSEELNVLTQQVLRQLDTWEISPEKSVQLLGVSEEVKPRQLQSYRTGLKTLSADSLERMGHIVGIGEALRTTYPFSAAMQIKWLNQVHRRFAGKTPLEVMMQEGVDGLLKVRVELDCTYGYALADAQYQKSKEQSA